MAFDPSLCEEKHIGVQRGFNRVWWTFGVLVAIATTSLGYAITQATSAHETAVAAKSHSEASSEKLDEILRLLKEKK